MNYYICARRVGASLPVIFLTAKAESEDIVKGFKAGGVDYVMKPFCTSELLTRIETHVRLHQLKSLISMCSYCR